MQTTKSHVFDLEIQSEITKSNVGCWLNPEPVIQYLIW
jgi:hypothetical protein